MTIRAEFSFFFLGQRTKSLLPLLFLPSSPTDVKKTFFTFFSLLSRFDVFNVCKIFFERFLHLCPRPSFSPSRPLGFRNRAP